MYKKLVVAGTVLVLMTLMVGLCSAPASSAATRYMALRYRVVGHMKTYDLVKGHQRTLRVHHHRSYVNVNGIRRYRVVKRNHRYVVLRRVAALAPATATILAGAPVSVGMPSTASSVWTGTPPSAANDGQAATRWAASGSRSYPQWWSVDLGVSKTVYGVKTAWYGANRSYRYRIATSLDGIAFTTVADRSRNQNRDTTTDAFTTVARYVRVTMSGVSPSGVAASAYEITVNGAVDSTPPPTPEPTPSPTPTVTPTPTPTPTVTPTALSISSLSASHAAVGASITIAGSGFGSTQGTSEVTFGERTVSWTISGVTSTVTPVAKTATIQAWSDSSIRVTVPSMAPGVAGEPGTYHPVYVTVGGTMSNSYNFYVDPVTTVSNQNFVTNSSNGNSIGLNNGTNSNLATYGHDVLFDNCTFDATNTTTINGDAAGVVTLANANYNVTFHNCTIKSNMGSGASGPFWWGIDGMRCWGDVHDITIDTCTFEEVSRMSVEVVGPNAPTNYPYNWAIKNCTFEPPMNQVISWSGGNNAINSVIENCLIKGWGHGAQGGAWFEANGSHHIVTRNCDVWTGGVGGLNVNCYNGYTTDPSTGPSYLYFEGINIWCDTAHNHVGTSISDQALMMECEHMHYAMFKNCNFWLGDTTTHYNCAGPVGWGAPDGWANNTYNDLSTCTMGGFYGRDNAYPDPNSAYYSAPNRLVKQYWSWTPAGIHSSNLLPTYITSAPSGRW